MKDKLDLFHALVAEERYREARGILETEDLPPQTVEKWTAWLDELHRDERRLQGVLTDDKKVPKGQSYALLVQVNLSLLASIFIGIRLWGLVEFVFTYETATPVYGGFFLLAGVILGFLGWRHLAMWFSPNSGIIIGAFVMMILLGIVLSSGMPSWYYYEPPVHYLIAGFALIFPYPVILCWQGIGWGIRKLMPSATDTESKKSAR